MPNVDREAEPVRGFAVGGRQVLDMETTERRDVEPHVFPSCTSRVGLGIALGHPQDRRADLVFAFLAAVDKQVRVDRDLDAGQQERRLGLGSRMEVVWGESVCHRLQRVERLNGLSSVVLSKRRDCGIIRALPKHRLRGNEWIHVATPIC